MLPNLYTTMDPLYKDTPLIRTLSRVHPQGSAQNCLSGGYPGAKLLARMQYKCICRPVARLLERGVTKLCDNKDDMILCFSCNRGTYIHN